MRRNRFIGLALLCLAGQAQADGEYHFRYNGKEIEPQVDMINGEVGHPAAGDVADLGSFQVVLDGPGNYDFTGDERRLMARWPGHEGKICVAVTVEEPNDTVGDAARDSLSRMSPADKANLRCVVLKGQPVDKGDALAGIDWSHAVMVVDYPFCGERNCKKLPTLPEKVRYFRLHLSMFPSIEDVSSLHGLRSLVYLQLESQVSLDVAELAAGPRLRYFGAGGARLPHTDALAKWKELRVLDLSGVQENSDMAWISGLSKLQRLELQYSAVKDFSALSHLKDLRELGLHGCKVASLEPLGHLPRLEDVRATESGVTKLPNNPVMPAMKKLSLVGAPVDEKALVDFRNRVPGCVVLHGWKDALASALSGVDRLRVRSGGTCHRNVSAEKTIFEVKDKVELARLVASLELDEKHSGGECMCCGDSTLEFYTGEKLAVSLGFHHGERMRWADGEWPGDARTTPETGEAWCRLLAQHGHSQPLDELMEARERAKAWNRYLEVVAPILPAKDCETWRQWAEDNRGEQLEADARKRWPENVQRAEKLFTMYGAMPTRKWRESCGLDEWLQRYLLPSVETKDVAELLRQADLPPAVLQGISRHYLFERDGADLLRKLPPDCVKTIGRWSLRHPQPDNRTDALLGLAGMKDDTGDALLLEYLDKMPEARPLAKEDRTGPGSKVEYQPREFVLPDGLDVRQTAAHLLALRKYAKALPVIRRVAGEVPEKEREAYRKAAEALEKAK